VILSEFTKLGGTRGLILTDFSLKYGEKTLIGEIPEENLLGIIQPRKALKPATDEERTIREALARPIGTPPLSEIVHKDQQVVIVVDDHTRSTPTHWILPPLVDELITQSIDYDQITIIFATGTHRAVNPNEAKQLLGSRIAQRLHWLSHDCRDNDTLVDLDSTSFNTPILFNRTYVEADLKILTGDVCFHYYAGFGGGRKSVLPGISGDMTIQKNHSLFLNPNARTGIIDGNPVHLDMVEGALKAPPQFIVNVALTTDNIISKAWAGNMSQAWLQGVKTYSEAYSAPISNQADIVVVSAGGFPKDIDFYQAYKALDAAIVAVRRGGTIVLVAECREDVGNPVFEDWMRKFLSLKEASREINKNFALGGHKAFLLLKALDHCHVIMVSRLPDNEAETTFQLEPAETLDEALERAFKRMGEAARAWVMPDGYTTLPLIST
jgi:nickel-dependent lactate racemase